MLACNVFKTVMRLFIEFPFNNLLHHQATTMIIHSLMHPQSVMLDALFVECDLLTWITDAPTEVTPQTVTPEQKAKNSNLKAGYHGYMTKLANAVHKLGIAREAVRSYLEANSKWKVFVENEI